MRPVATLSKRQPSHPDHHDCFWCNGDGHIPTGDGVHDTTCPVCRGTGEVSASKPITVTGDGTVEYVEWSPGQHPQAPWGQA